MERRPAIYILTNRPNGTLYLGVISNLPQRCHQHQHNLLSGFTSRYNLHRLVYFETHETMNIAIAREKQLKSGSRRNKVNLIEGSNPTWRDLTDEL